MSTKILFLSEVSVVLLTANLLVTILRSKTLLTGAMASSFRGAFCIKHSKGVFET